MYQPETCRDAWLLVVEVAEALCFLTELFLVPAKDLLAASLWELVGGDSVRSLNCLLQAPAYRGWGRLVGLGF